MTIQRSQPVTRELRRVDAACGGELLTQAHRRWIETRDPKDGDKFAALVAELTRKSQP